MPTPINKIHQLYKLKSNRLDSNANSDIPPAFIDLLLWESLNEYVDIFYSGSDKQLKLGFETTQQRLDLIKDFIVTYPEQPTIIPATINTNYYGLIVNNFNFSNLLYKYKHFVRGTVVDSCNNRYKIDKIQQDDLDYKLNDTHQRPSVKWQRVVSTINKNQLQVYSELQLTGLELSYVKVPNKPFYGGYNTLEYLAGDTLAPSSSSAKIDVELDDAYSNILTDLMVINTSSYIGDYNKSQEIRNKFQLNN